MIDNGGDDGQGTEAEQGLRMREALHKALVGWEDNTGGFRKRLLPDQIRAFMNGEIPDPRIPVVTKPSSTDTSSPVESNINNLSSDLKEPTRVGVWSSETTNPKKIIYPDTSRKGYGVLRGKDVTGSRVVIGDETRMIGDRPIFARSSVPIHANPTPLDKTSLETRMEKMRARIRPQT